ncbi:WXG100 family type VII secretion target [Streptomyces sp. NPDC001591]|uniref:WXG100 family type VII secretion target n=1 Tax=Streptomyces sp. NPDC001591 TaxID=3364589 RepID=UPI0036974C77
MATTNFEGYSHEQLLAMIASLDPETVKARATQLAEAAKAIKEIGKSLKDHKPSGWEGEAAHALEVWLRSTGNATLSLGDYSEAGSTWLTHAAQTMVEVKANTPKYDRAAADDLAAARTAHNDPDAQQLAQTSHTKLTTDHQQAIQQLTKLAQSYEASVTQLSRTEPPTFPPPPPDFHPRDPYNGQSYIGRTPGVSGNPGAAGSASGSADFDPPGDPDWDRRRPPSFDSPLPPTAGPTTTPAVLPDRTVDVSLSHAATLADTPPPTPSLPVGPAHSGPAGNFPTGAVPPLMPVIGGSPSLGAGPLPIKPPSVGVGGKVGGIPLPPRDTGIVGGRAVSTGGSSGSIPHGAVIGGEGPYAGGRGMPGMMGGGLGGPHGAASGSASGRRLATEPGGVVGGRQAVASRQPFTQGGSGLVRNGPGVSGTVGHGGAGAQAPRSRSGGQGGSRPDYLTEDEETWKGDRRVVPPVID